MKLVSALFASALIAASAGVAAADTIQIASYGSINSAAATHAQNTALSYTGYQLINSAGANVGTKITFLSPLGTYDLTQNLSPWTAAQSNSVGNSYWVAQDPCDSPGGCTNAHGPNTVTVEPTGGYYFSTTFTDSNAADSSGSISVMADDTTNVYLNGHLVELAASTATSGTCDSGTPNCTIPVSVFLPTQDFISGTNTLSFEVLQEHGSAEGVDFVGSVNVTPEPNSLLLLGTGLAMMAGFAYYRRVQA